MSEPSRLSAKLTLIDEVTSKFSSIVAAGTNVVSTFSDIDEASNNSFDTTSASNFADALGTVGSAAEDVGEATKTAAKATDDFDTTAVVGLADALSEAGSAAEDVGEATETVAEAAKVATEATDHWTEAVGNYDKSLLSAIYTTQELVDMGYKTKEALEEEAAAAEASITVTERGTTAMGQFRDTIKEQEEELANLQEAYMGLALTMGKDSEEAISLKQEIEDLSKTLDENKDELGDLEEASGQTGEAGSEMVKKIENALTAAALAKTIKEIAEEVYEMANAWSDAESVIAKATGATGGQLDDLRTSMLRVYATVDDADMNNTAGALGEINTRLGLQGKQLEHVTGLFMQYADNNNTEVVGSVQNITKVMKNWNVEVDDTENLLDKFTYAAQASGASVDNLSSQVYQNKAFLDQLGYSLDESIGLFAMLEYEGIEASSVMMGFRTALTNFAKDGLDAKTAMQDVIYQISSMEDASEATSLAVATFGSRVGAQLTDKIRSGKFEIEDWTAAIADAGGTLAETDDAADTLSDKWTMASNSLNVAFTTVLSPAVTAASEALAGFVQGVGDYLNEHPGFTKALTALGAGLVALAGYIIVTKVAALASIPSFTALAAAVWSATGPIGLAVAGIAALVVGLGFLVSAIVGTDSDFKNLTASAKDQHEELEALNAEYEETVALYGESSYEAQSLKWQIDDLTAAYEANRMSLKEFIAANDQLIESHENLVATYRSNTLEINKSEASNDALIGKLLDLGNATEQTAGTQAQMKAIIEALNGSIDGLNLSYEDFSGNVHGTIEQLEKMAQAQADQERYTENYATYVDLVKQHADLEAQLALATTNAVSAQERYDNAGGWEMFWGSGDANWNKLHDYYEEVDRLTVVLDENVQMQDDLTKAMESYAVATEESIEETDGFRTALESIEQEVIELADAYDEVYQAAYESISSQIELFGTMATEVVLSTDEMMDALESQSKYLETYVENLRLAAQYGLDEGLISSLSDGSTESAGYLQSIINEVEKLGGSVEGMGEDATSFVKEFNTAFQKTEEAKNQFATTVAEMETDFSASMSEIESRMNDTIDNLELEDAAAAAARNTIHAYINQIKSMTSEVGNAASAVSAAAFSALWGDITGAKNVSAYAGSVSAYAGGTVNADDIYIAGEKGPELIVGAGGSTVFPTSETAQLLNAIEFGQQRELDTGLLAATRMLTESNTTSTSSRHITLDINGTGELTIDGSLSEEQVMELLVNNLKPVLMGIVRTEMMEEGIQTHEF